MFTKVTGFAVSEHHYRVLAVAAHPVQYMAPIFRRMANHPAFDLHVSYCTLRGAKKGHVLGIRRRDPVGCSFARWLLLVPPSGV